MKTLFIIDANSLIHRAYHALPPFTSPSGKPTGALYGLSNILLKILRDRKPDYIAAAFDRPEPTFRHHQFAEYKGTRAKADEDLISQLKEARNVFNMFGIKNFELAGWEADDIIVTLAKRFASQDLKVQMLSGDLDLLQVVDNDRIVLETPKKGIGDTALYNSEGVVQRFGVNPEQMPDYRGLVGETSDNIPGVPGIGPKTAVQLIQQYGTLEEMYKEIDELGMSNLKLMKKLVDNKDEALRCKMLATLRRDVPLEVVLEDLKANPLNQDKLKNYLTNLGFTSLIGRIS